MKSCTFSRYPEMFDPTTERYVSLATLRRNGQEVLTPVWLARHNDCYYLFSESRAGKVKRIRANAAVRLAACNSVGEVASDWLEAEARLLTDARLVDAAHLALREKYGWQMMITDFFSRLFGRDKNRTFIELRIRDTGTA